MKVLLINGSPRVGGNTALALEEMVKVFEKHGVECETVQVGGLAVKDCLSCNYCYKNGKCAIDDIVNELALKFEECDGLVVGSPVYYAGPNAALCSILDRLFYSTNFDKTMKVGAAICAARRGGLSAAFDRLNKYFTISSMAVAGSQYWNGVHGRRIGEAPQDSEGMQTMRTLAENMTFLMKSIALGKEKYGLPEKEAHISTDFLK